MATTLNVSGMSCDGCEEIVETALSEVDGVADAEADHEAGTATVEGDADAGDLLEAVDFAGYEGDLDGASGDDETAEDESDDDGSHPDDGADAEDAADDEE